MSTQNNQNTAHDVMFEYAWMYYFLLKNWKSLSLYQCGIFLLLSNKIPLRFSRQKNLFFGLA